MSEILNTISILIWELKNFKESAPQMELIKNEYPYLLNYLKVKDTMDFNKDIEKVYKIGESLKKTKFCPCMINQNENTVCPCLPCRTKNKCICELFVSIK